MIITQSPLKHYTTIQEYQDFASRFTSFEDPQGKVQFNRLLCRTDLFWLLWYACGKHYVAKQWILDRCKEVESDFQNTLDIWSREHFKSTLLTYGKSIQNILASHGDDPLPEWPRETTIGILSVTRPLAKGFLREIKQTFEDNQLLKSLFPDILYQNPKAESKKWSEDEGICVKRKSVYKEQTIEAWGLIDGQPTGKHFFELAYDDIVTQDSVTTPEMIQKTTAAFGLSDNIGTRGGIYRIVGTFYHANDTLNEVIRTGVYKLRKYAGTYEGKWPIASDAEAPLLTKKELELKAIKQGPYIFSCQILLNPVASSLQNFKESWLKYYGGWAKHYTGNIYIIVDPANSKKKSSDYTVMFVVAACDDQNYYVIDIIRDRLNLKERTEALFKLVKQYYSKGLIHVGYEQYGMQADIEHIREKQDELNYHFIIRELGGLKSKIDRIGKLVPDFENQRIYVPRQIMKTNYEGKLQNLVDIFIKEEYLCFPTSQHDDMLDALARIKDDDLKVSFPLPPLDDYEDSFNKLDDQTRNSTTGY